MGRKFKLAHKKHSSVKKEAAHDEEIGGSVDNCTQTDFDAVTFESASTQTDTVTIMNVGVQTTEDESTEHMHAFVISHVFNIYSESETGMFTP